MSEYKKISKKPNFAEMQDQVLQLWKSKGIKKKVLNLNKDTGEVFSFYEGPPTANGNPHAGHVLTRSLKDVYTRYAGMKGYYVPRKGGWDTHGLPVEISVEKTLGISGKHDIEKFGVAKFIDACKNNVWTCIDMWKEFSDKVGYSLDLDEDCYVPYENNYIESVWWSLAELDKKGLLYKGYKILPSCPSCQTALSSHEVAQGYKDKKDLTAVVKFPCKDIDATFIAWTTTPWTLTSNVGLCVSPTLEYAFVKHTSGETFVIAVTQVKSYFKEEEISIEKLVKGCDLAGLIYEPLFDYSKFFGKQIGYRVVADDFVKDDEGTGIVHMAPAFGEDDARVSMANNLPFLQLVDQTGHFTEKCVEYSGKYIFEEAPSMNEQVVEDLTKANKLFKKQWMSHSYPHCWRCGTPLMYYARDGWFIKTTAFKDELIKCNNEINWFPETYKTGRMGNFLQNNIDWCLSRNRYWGTPLPVWTCSCGYHKTVGSIKELVELTNCDENIELHKPYIDEVTMTCPHCGEVMHREKDVIDVWYDSGAMPFAQFHYPFENKEEFERRYPADFVFEGYDQTRGWFYTLEAINVPLFGKAPMKNCLANGMICDSQGYKMSKSRGNYEDPMTFINRYGGDVVRFMFYSNGQPYNDVIFSENLLQECQRKFNDVLYNVYSFYVLYADACGYDGKDANLEDKELSIMDKYILSKLNKLIADVSTSLTDYKATEASRALIEFVDLLSNWYIRGNRKRFYYLDTKDNLSAFATLYNVLKALSRLCAPFIPFLAEDIYQTIEFEMGNSSEESVHLCSFPVSNSKYINDELELKMEKTSLFCELGRMAREKSSIKIRQPLSKLFISDESYNAVHLDEEFLKIIADELNIESVAHSHAIEDYLSFAIKPNLPKIGPRYGRLLNKIRQYLLECDTRAVRNCVKNGDTWKFTIDDTAIELGAEDLLITNTETPGYQSAFNETLFVVLDCSLNDELLEKGYIREFISRMQKARKEFDYDMSDRIKIQISGTQRIIDILNAKLDYIKKELLIEELVTSTDDSFNTTEWAVNETETIVVKMKRA